MGFRRLSVQPVSSRVLELKPATASPQGYYLRRDRDPCFPVLISQLDDDEFTYLDFSPDKSPIRWHLVFDFLAAETEFVWAKRGLSPDADAWFVQWRVGARGAVLGRLRELSVQGIRALQEKFSGSRFRCREEVLLLAGRLLARLIEPTSSIHKTPRSWFGRQKRSDNLWFQGLSLISHSSLGRFSEDVPTLLWMLDECSRLIAIRTRCPVSALVPLQKQGGGALGWDLTPLEAIRGAADRAGVSWRGLLLLLLQRELERSRQRGYAPRADLASLAMYLPTIASQDMALLPMAGSEEWKVETLLVMGLPGGCALPDQIRFGLDARQVERADMRLVRLTESGQVVYQDYRGKTHSEGTTLALTPEVAAWGKGLQLWCNAKSAPYLHQHWYNPPPRCPWAWYAQWGSGDYLRSGEPVRPDRFRAAVQWLEGAA